MKRRTLQVCSLKHIIKKDKFPALGKLNLFKSDKGVLLSSPCPFGYGSAQWLSKIVNSWIIIFTLAGLRFLINVTCDLPK